MSRSDNQVGVPPGGGEIQPNPPERESTGSGLDGKDGSRSPAASGHSVSDSGGGIFLSPLARFWRGFWNSPAGFPGGHRRSVRTTLARTSSGKPADTIPLIDVMRVLAAWLVLAWHTGVFVGYRLPVLSSAAIAVDVFMNVSGFLMVFLFMERREKEPWAQPLTWSKFYIRRFFRITPLYYCLLLFLVVAGLTPPARTDGSSLSTWHWLLLRVSFLFGLIPSQCANCVMPDWSLTLEMQFYLCFPFLFLTMMRVGPGLFFFLCTLVGAVARFGIAHGFYDRGEVGLLGYFAQPTVLALKLHVFAVGMLMALVLMRGPGILKSKWYWAAFPVFLMTCQERYLWLMAAIYWGCYVACAVPRFQARFLNGVRTLNETLRRVPLRQKLAECSYGTYLMHNLVIGLLLSRIWPQFSSVHGSFGQYALCFAVNLVVTTALSWSTYRLIEKPGIDLGRRIIRKLGPGFTRRARLPTDQTAP